MDTIDKNAREAMQNLFIHYPAIIQGLEQTITKREHMNYTEWMQDMQTVLTHPPHYHLL